jgi:hypothetical protein
VNGQQAIIEGSAGTFVYTVTCAAADGTAASSAATVTVANLVLAISPASVDLTAGSNAVLTVTATGPGGAVAVPANLIWASSDPTIATVVDGLVTTVANGVATVTVTDPISRATASATVAVGAALTPGPAPLAGLSSAPAVAGSSLGGLPPTYTLVPWGGGYGSFSGSIPLSGGGDIYCLSEPLSWTMTAQPKQVQLTVSSSMEYIPLSPTTVGTLPVCPYPYNGFFNANFTVVNPPAVLHIDAIITGKTVGPFPPDCFLDVLVAPAPPGATRSDLGLSPSVASHQTLDLVLPARTDGLSYLVEFYMNQYYWVPNHFPYLQAWSCQATATTTVTVQ